MPTVSKSYMYMLISKHIRIVPVCSSAYELGIVVHRCRLHDFMHIYCVKLSDISKGDTASIRKESGPDSGSVDCRRVKGV